MQLKLSHTVPDLIRPVAGWLYSEWGHHLPNRSVDTAEYALRQSPNSEGLPSTVIAIEGHEPVGVARLVESDLESRPDLKPWLASVFVPEHKRNRGIGIILCSEVIDIARQYGFSTLYLFTPDRAPYYERQGWSVVGYERYRDIQVTLMKLEIGEQDDGANDPQRG
jgi:predicted N-acetyltransferase YhbS